MRRSVVGAAALAGACVLPTAAFGQDAALGQPTSIATAAADPASDPDPAISSECCTIPALTVVELEFVDPASSRSSKTGDKIALRLAEPVMVDGRTVIPAGTRGFAEVIQASKGRMMGKAGELTLGLPYLELDGRRISLKRLRYGRSQGSDPSGTLTTLNVAAAAALPIASTALIFISGGNVDIASGAPAHAVVTTETSIPVAPSTDTPAKEPPQ